MSGIELVISDGNGIYIPQLFAEIIRRGEGSGSWQGYDEKELKTLEEGPEAEWYWEAWQGVVDNTTFTDSNGDIWCFYQDGDLFAYCDRLMTDEEYKDFFGEDRYVD